MKSSRLREKIIISYESYQNNGYIDTCLVDVYPIVKIAYYYHCDINKIINGRIHYNDFSEYTLFYIYYVLTTYKMLYHYRIEVPIDQFLDNFLENNPFIFIDERKEINLYHLLMLLVDTENFNNKSLGKILTRISIEDVFSYVSYIHETRLKRYFNRIHVDNEYTYLMFLLSEYCLTTCRNKLLFTYETNNDADGVGTLHYLIIDSIKNKDIYKYKINESLIEIYTKYINLIDEYFMGKINKDTFKTWFYDNKTYCYRTKPRIYDIMYYLFKFYNDYVNGS